MPQSHIACDRCGSWSIITNIYGTVHTRPNDPLPQVYITILCPKCGKVELIKQRHEIDGEGVAQAGSLDELA